MWTSIQLKQYYSQLYINFDDLSPSFCEPKDLLAILKNHKIVSYKVAKGSKSANLEFLNFFLLLLMLLLLLLQLLLMFKKRKLPKRFFFSAREKSVFCF